MARPIVANPVMNFMGELMVRIQAHPKDRKLLAEARRALRKLDNLAEQGKRNGK